MAVLKLPRLQTGTAIVDHANGKPITALTRFWDAAMSQIEDNLNAVIAAQAAADAAQGTADTAQASADAAQADADAAQATADAAKATADALDAALDVAAGKILHVLNTMTLAGIDGSTLNIGTGGTLGTAAFTNASDYLPSGSSGAFLAKANNLSDVASVATARANLGISATGADPAYALKANNLSDLASIPAARGNLGLGTAATQNTGTAGATVPFLNGANTWGAPQTFGGVTILNPSDSASAVLVSGATNAVRIGTFNGGANISGVDKTGSASYQPLELGGSKLTVTCSFLIQGLLNAASDAAASGLGVPVTGVYRNGSVLMVRVT